MESSSRIDPYDLELDFTRSLQTEENPFLTTEEALTWLYQKREETTVNIKEIPFADMAKWGFDEEGNLRHNSGKFFSIEGVEVTTNHGWQKQWSQPIINQPEVGYLGIITKKIDGVLYFLMQAKIEPGNVNYVQFSPTLQATKSNYTQVHKGNAPLYLEYFQSSERKVLIDQLQSEQGARFLKKRNRNIIILVEDEIEVLSNFCWLTLGQINKLMTMDNVVNMDTRTVVAGIPLSETLFDSMKKSTTSRAAVINARIEAEDRSMHSRVELISWITSQKTHYEMDSRSIPMNEVENWVKDDYSIHHPSGNFFSVIATEVEIGNREVQRWTQPIIKPAQDGIIAFLTYRFYGLTHFLVQAKVEVGNFDIVELAPSVQCITGSYKKANPENQPPFLENVLNADTTKVLFDSKQSEEGGRFYREQNRSLVIELDEMPESLPKNYIWMSYDQLKTFIQFNNYLNIQSRSLLAMYGHYLGKGE
ncbi:MAG: oxidase EvaA [Granulosicoccus sp.]|jgi:oxidase EvaA